MEKHHGAWQRHAPAEAIAAFQQSWVTSYPSY